MQLLSIPLLSVKAAVYCCGHVCGLLTNHTQQANTDLTKAAEEYCGAIIVIDDCVCQSYCAMLNLLGLWHSADVHCIRPL